MRARALAYLLYGFQEYQRLFHIAFRVCRMYQSFHMVVPFVFDDVCDVSYFVCGLSNISRFLDICVWCLIECINVVPHLCRGSSKVSMCVLYLLCGRVVSVLFHCLTICPYLFPALSSAPAFCYTLFMFVACIMT